MLEAWKQSPGYFVMLAVSLLSALIVVVVAFLKNRGFRHVERMRAMELNRVAESFFAGRLLGYIPWQFWTSFAILIALIGSSLITGGETQKVFLELTKYVTGAVIGSLFGEKARGQMTRSEERNQDNERPAPDSPTNPDARQVSLPRAG